MAKYKVEMNGYQLDDYKTLTHQETMDLLNQYHETQNESLKDTLVYSNVKLVLSLVQKYQNRVSNMDDLFQVGVIGLIKAIDNFDTSLNVRFSTYAVPLILGEMKRYMRDNSPLRISRSIRDIAYKALMYSEDFQKKNNREPTIPEIAQELGVSEMLINEAIASTHSVTSLSCEVHNDGSGSIDLESQLPNKKDQLKNISQKIDLHDALALLDEKERQVINERYYRGHTQNEIAKELFISQAQVSRIEKQALSQLKKYLGT